MATYSVDNLTISATPSDDGSNFIQVASGDVFPNDGLTFLWVKASAAITGVTITVPSQISTAAPTGLGPIPIAAYTFNPVNTTLREYLIGPFAPTRFNNSSGQVTVNYTGTVSSGVVMAKAVKFTPIA